MASSHLLSFFETGYPPPPLGAGASPAEQRLPLPFLMARGSPDDPEAIFVFSPLSEDTFPGFCEKVNRARRRRSKTLFFAIRAKEMMKFGIRLDRGLPFGRPLFPVP